MMSWSDKRIVFVPSCMLCPAFQAKPTDKNMLWQQQITVFLFGQQIGMVQMPCPEASFPEYTAGIARKPHGISYYEKIPGFVAHCQKMAYETVQQIKEMSQAGYVIEAIIGIEHSPTCAASYLYTNHGTEKRKGIYLSAINTGLRREQLDIPIIGINRRYPEKFIRDMNLLWEKKGESTKNDTYKADNTQHK